jgi:hypothetical protein
LDATGRLVVLPPDPGAYVGGFLMGIASCLGAPLQQIWTDGGIYAQIAWALARGDPATAGNILQLKGVRDRQNFDAFLRSFNQNIYGVAPQEAGPRPEHRQWEILAADLGDIETASPHRLHRGFDLGNFRRRQVVAPLCLTFAHIHADPCGRAFDRRPWRYRSCRRRDFCVVSGHARSSLCLDLNIPRYRLPAKAWRPTPGLESSRQMPVTALLNRFGGDART